MLGRLDVLVGRAQFVDQRRRVNLGDVRLLPPGARKGGGKLFRNSAPSVAFVHCVPEPDPGGVLVVSADPELRRIVRDMVGRSVKQQPQAAAGVLVRAGVVGPREQLTTRSVISHSTAAPTTHGGQASRAVVRGGEVDCFLRSVVGQKLAMGLCADKADLDCRDCRGKLRGNTHPVLAQSHREAEQRPRFP